MKDETRKLLYQIHAFILTYLFFATFHATRTIYSFSTFEMVIDPVYHFTKYYIGITTLAFMLCYSLGFFFIGHLGDRFDLRLYLASSGLVTTISFGLLAVMRFFEYRNLWLFVVFFGISGFAQSPGLTGTTAVMGNWIASDKRALVFGFWSTNPSIGNILGYMIGFIVVSKLGFVWHYGFAVATVLCALLTIILFLTMEPYPEKLNIQINDPMYEEFSDLDSGSDDEKEKEKVSPLNKSPVKQKSPSPSPIRKKISQIPNKKDENEEVQGMLDIIKIPKVFKYIIGYTILKSTIYAMLFWLAFFLQSRKLSSHVSTLASTYEAGLIFGGIGLGTIIDCALYGKKSILIPFSLLFLAFDFCLINWVSHYHISLYYILLFLAGYLLGGPYTLLYGAITADLGKDPQIKGKSVVATISAMMNGSGSLGASILQICIPFFMNTLFYVLSFLIIVSALIFFPMAWQEMKEFKEIRHKKKEFHFVMGKRFSIEDEVQHWKQKHKDEIQQIKDQGHGNKQNSDDIEIDQDIQKEVHKK